MKDSIEGCYFKNIFPSRIIIHTNNNSQNINWLLKSQWIPKFDHVHYNGNSEWIKGLEEHITFEEHYQDINPNYVKMGEIFVINLEDQKIGAEQLKLFKNSKSLGIITIIMSNIRQNLNLSMQANDLYFYDSSSKNEVILKKFALLRASQYIPIDSTIMIRISQISNALISTPFDNYCLYLDEKLQQGIYVSKKILDLYYSSILLNSKNFVKIICVDKSFNLKQEMQNRFYFFKKINCIFLIKELSINFPLISTVKRQRCQYGHIGQNPKTCLKCHFCKKHACRDHILMLCKTCSPFNPSTSSVSYTNKFKN